MLVVRVELHSAVTHKVQEIARMDICNTGEGDANYGNYIGYVMIGRSKEALDMKKFSERRGRVYAYPRLKHHVWNLVEATLRAAGYGGFEAHKPEWATEQLVRETGLLEDICEHGVGHPNRDFLQRFRKHSGIHGCDGCCGKKKAA